MAMAVYYPGVLDHDFKDCYTYVKVTRIKHAKGDKTIALSAGTPYCSPCACMDM